MVVEVLAVLDPFDPVTDFIPELEQANAALLVIANAMAATKLSNRLDIGSPPFRKSGTCRAATIADPRRPDKRALRPRAPARGSRRGNGHIRSDAPAWCGAAGPRQGLPLPVDRRRPPLMRQAPGIMLESRLQDIQAVSTQCHYRPFRRIRGVFGSTSLP